MWLETEGSAHKRFINTDVLESLYVSYGGSGHWRVCASKDNLDLVIKEFANEAIANNWLAATINQIKNEK